MCTHGPLPLAVPTQLALAGVALTRASMGLHESWPTHSQCVHDNRRISRGDVRSTNIHNEICMHAAQTPHLFTATDCTGLFGPDA